MLQLPEQFVARTLRRLGKLRELSMMGEVTIPKRRQLGLLFSALVLVADTIPLGLWEFQLIDWARQIHAKLNPDVLLAALQWFALAVLTMSILLLGIAIIAVAGAAVSTTSGKAQGVLTGLLASYTVAGICAYLVSLGAARDLRLWYLCLGANSLSALYLTFYALRQRREATGSADSATPPDH